MLVSELGLSTLAKASLTLEIMFHFQHNPQIKKIYMLSSALFLVHSSSHCPEVSPWVILLQRQLFFFFRICNMKLHRWKSTNSSEYLICLTTGSKIVRRWSQDYPRTNHRIHKRRGHHCFEVVHKFIYVTDININIQINTDIDLLYQAKPKKIRAGDLERDWMEIRPEISGHGSIAF